MAEEGGMRLGFSSSVCMSNRVRADVALKGCNASKTHVLLQLRYTA